MLSPVRALGRSALSACVTMGVLLSGATTGHAAAAAQESDGVTALACPAVTSCWSINERTSSSQLIHWNGKASSLVSVPTPSAPAGATVGSALYALACTSVDSCWAVGSYGVTQGNDTSVKGYLAVHWNGKTWRVVPAPLPAADVTAAAQPGLQGISCISAAGCWAVGSAAGHFSATHWDGRSWTPAPDVALSPADAAEIGFDVSCSQGSCWAVGVRSGNGSDRSLPGDSYLALHLVAGRWVKAAVPAQPVAGLPYPKITCAAANSCWIVGTVQHALQSTDNDMLHWNGKRWAWMSVPSLGGHGTFTLHGEVFPRQSELASVSCASVDNCWAVGGYLHLGSLPVIRSQALHWNGSRWSAMPAPKPSGTGDNVLSGVDCHAASNCRVIGFGVTPTRQAKAVLARWNGKAWVA